MCLGHHDKIGDDLAGVARQLPTDNCRVDRVGILWLLDHNPWKTFSSGPCSGFESLLGFLYSKNTLLSPAPFSSFLRAGGPCSLGPLAGEGHLYA